MTEQLKLCKDCKHYAKDEQHTCLHMNSQYAISVVDGSNRYYSCFHMRSNALFCGEKAGLFEEDGE